MYLQKFNFNRLVQKSNRPRSTLEKPLQNEYILLPRHGEHLQGFSPGGHLYLKLDIILVKKKKKKKIK